MIKKLLWPISALLICVVLYFTLSLLWQVMAEEPIPIVFNWGVTLATEEMGDAIPAGTLFTVHQTGSYSAGEIIVFLDAENIPHLLTLETDTSNTTAEGCRIIGSVVHQFPDIPSLYEFVEKPAIEILQWITGLLEDLFSWLDSLISGAVEDPTTAAGQ